MFDAAPTAAASRHRREEILDEIIRIQREYFRDGDPQRMWDLLIEAILTVTGSAYGFIGEVEWGHSVIPRLETKAVRWLADVDGPVAPHPDVGLVVSQVIATEAPLILDRTDHATAQPRFSPASGFLGLPLRSADRMVAVVGLTGPETGYDAELVAYLEPLLAACAAIVESIQAERARDAAVSRLERTAGFLNAVIESTAHGILVVNVEDGLIESANRAAHLLLDPPGATVVGSKLDGLLDPDQAIALRRILRLVRRRGLWDALRSFEMQLPRPEGDILPVEAMLSEFSIGGNRRLVVLFRDISDRVEAERTSTRVMEIIEAAPDLIAWSGVTGNLLYMNDGGRQLIGPDAGETDVTFPGLCTPASRTSLVDEAIPTALLDGSWSGELELVDAAGTEIPVWMVILGGGADGSEYLAYLARDLRERRQIERIKEAFVSSVSHELRTPLTSILGYVEMMADGAFGEVSTQMKDALDVVQRNGDRLLDLIGQILRVSLVAEDQPGFSDVVDLSDLVSSTVGSLSGVVTGQHTQLDVEPGITILGDPNDLMTMVANLVGNAYKFTPPTGSVTISLHRVGDWTSFEVRDTGIGIPEDELDQVFQRFYRGELARRHEVQGTGLGLAIVDAVVRRHRGRVSASSRMGVGSSFRVMLPMETEERR